jgi:hypothetical protein
VDAIPGEPRNYPSKTGHWLVDGQYPSEMVSKTSDHGLSSSGLLPMPHAIATRDSEQAVSFAVYCRLPLDSVVS